MRRLAEPVKMEMETTVTTADGAGTIPFLRRVFDNRVYPSTQWNFL